MDIQQSKRTTGDVLAGIAADQTHHADVIRDFHRAFYASRQTHGMTFFEGIPLLKNPLDLWVYQEIIWDLEPTLIIETGTAFGGSALFFARCLEKKGQGRVISIDPDPAERLPKHERIFYIQESSTSLSVLEVVEKIAKTHPRVMVVLDSDHSASHVTDELDSYAPMVSPGQFLVVEDTNINGRPVDIDWKGGDGPGPAVDTWLPQHPEFERAVMAERYLLTFFPGGWLRRRHEAEDASAQ